MFINIKDLETHLRGEVIDLISRADQTIVEAAIDGAISEVKGYLSSYDTDMIFKAEGDKRHALMLIFTKDVAVWHFINLCSAANNYEKREGRYKRACEWLKGVQRGDISPDLPKIADAPKLVLSSSNPKRTTHF